MPAERSPAGAVAWLGAGGRGMTREPVAKCMANGKAQLA
jgi:hypothetical protein